MADLKLARLPDRTPVKLTISVSPELHAALTAYAALYAETYGLEEPVAALAPAMLAAFLDSDRTFMRSRLKSLPKGRRPRITNGPRRRYVPTSRPCRANLPESASPRRSTPRAIPQPPP